MVWTSMNGAFASCDNLTFNATDVPNFSQVKDMSGMLIDAAFKGNISNWDVSSVANMRFMFRASDSFNGDLSNWDVSNVTNMRTMFHSSDFNGSISDWNVSSVTTMSQMFDGAAFNQDLSKWDVRNVTNMSQMFDEAAFNQDISNWNVSKVTNMQNMFASSSFNQDISNWDVSNVTNMQNMFASSPFNQDLSNWDISNVTNIFFMFWNNSSMSSENYDKLLIGWSTLDTDAGETKIPKNIFFGAPDKYSCRGKAGRDALTGATHSWTITGDELISIRTEAAALSEVTSQCIASLTPPTAKSSCTIGEGTTVTAAHDVSTFPITESTLITWTYTHNSKSIVQTQTVTITEDTTPPTVTGSLAAVTEQCPIMAETDLTEPAAPSDNCGGTVTVALKAGTSFPIEAGTTTITWIYTDEAGNMSEQTQDVTITKDTTPPRVTGSLAAVTAQCPINAETDLTEPAAPSDNCKGTVNVALKSGTSFPIQAGTTTITWVYTDEAGNTSEQTQDVNIDDTEAPTVTGTLNTITSACSLAQDAVTFPKANDACDGEITATHDVASFPITSNTTITWTYTDNADNTATQMQNVTITLDGTDPVPVLPDLPAISEACKLESGDVTAPTAKDCSGTILTGTTTVFPMTESGTIEWTYTDSDDNTATQTQNVTITACVLSAAVDAVEAVVFPNPSGRYVEVQSPVESPIRVLSLGGELVLKSTTNTRIDAAFLHSGLYLVQLPDGRLLKFVKK
ncbi:MAG: BspA family leucine-rich repeat surface protein [Ekhidna sp.]|nr:BspA family leucine-rich repeat surface protein [Ekhidna sp.]